MTKFKYVYETRLSKLPSLKPGCDRYQYMIETDIGKFIIQKEIDQCETEDSALGIMAKMYGTFVREMRDESYFSD